MDIRCRLGWHKAVVPHPYKWWHTGIAGNWVYCARCGRAGLNMRYLLTTWGTVQFSVIEADLDSWNERFPTLTEKQER